MADYAKELARAHEQTVKQQEELKRKLEEKAAAGAAQTNDQGRKGGKQDQSATDDAYKGAPRNRN